ncbi:cysteine proteinase [Zopfia rhizophila CBS 207.26]|uniref:Cysteine proteinase n=1 Tax=Zopfia rhizophila CBS 207.26 TaxID=1314779 RepID=A0A6A6E4R0_9PEZI|nr:cysteine proteinase [Zopfia rhizophila CBS 207.26]
MATFTFGSVGDIIAICQVVQSAVSALNDARGSAADYQALSRSLSSLAQVLFKIDTLSKNKRCVVNMAGLDQTLKDCFKCLHDFYATIEKYSRALGAQGEKRLMKDIFRKIQWLSEKEDVSNFHRDISTYLAMLQLLLQLAGFEINAADQAALHRRMSDTDGKIAKGFLETYTLLEKIDRAVQLRGEGGVSNAAVAATAALKRLERRATLLVEEREATQDVSKAYEDAVSTCKMKLADVIIEYRRVNKVFADRDFDIDYDLRSGRRHCLESLDNSGAELSPGCVCRIGEIFERPRVLVEFRAETVVSLEGYRHFAVVMTTLQLRPELFHRIFVARDEAVDAYGFVFFRDGEWSHCIIDGRLYLERPEFSNGPAQELSITTKTRISESEYQKLALTGSRALYFAASSNENETAIPLLEKAYARSHGDYGAIQDLYIGDVLEDFTGGVTMETDLSSVLDRDKFWKTTLLKSKDLANQPIVFASNRRIETNNRLAMEDGWALVAVFQAVEVDGYRLLKLLCSNPENWEWAGAWSDGSAEWTPEWMMKLDHRFGDEVITWMSYRDFIRHFSFATIHRLFPSDWQTVQLWAAFEVPCTQDDLRDVFRLSITEVPSEEGTEVVIVLSQLDSSYF